MTRAFITRVGAAAIGSRAATQQGDRTLRHVANKQFRARGVAPGDRVYVVATRYGQLLLLGRLDVQHVVDQQKAERRLRPNDVYDAPDHLVSCGTTLELDRVAPEKIARQIERASGKRLKIAADEYRVDVNSLRTTGQITEESASVLDALLGE